MQIETLLWVADYLYMVFQWLAEHVESTVGGLRYTEPSADVLLRAIEMLAHLSQQPLEARHFITSCGHLVWLIWGLRSVVEGEQKAKEGIAFSSTKNSIKHQIVCLRRLGLCSFDKDRSNRPH